MSEEMSGGGDVGGSDGGGAPASSPDAGNFVAQPGLTGGDEGAGAEGDAGEGGEAAAEAAKAKAQAAAKYKIKRGGKDHEGTLEDLQKWASDDYEHELQIDGAVEKVRYPDLLSRARLGGAAMNRMREAKAERDRVQAYEKELLSNPTSIFERSGQDPLEWAIKRVQEEAQLEQMQASDPRGYAQKLVERQMRMAEMKAQREAEQKQAQAQQAQRQQQRRALYEALPAALGAKMSPTLNGIVGQLMHDAERSGYTPELAEVAMLAKSQLRRDMQAMVAEMGPDQIRELIGDAAMKRLRQSDVQSARQAEQKRLGMGNQPPPGAPGSKPQPGAPKLTPAQIIARNLGKH